MSANKFALKYRAEIGYTIARLRGFGCHCTAQTVIAPLEQPATP
jgi:hypothetical protein